MSGLYVYGVMQGEALARQELSDVFPEQQLLVVSRDALGAVVAATDQGKFEATEENLLHHFEVLSKLMKFGPVFPIRFGTVARSEEEIRSLLTSLSGMIDQVLERLGGKTEFDVEARWNPQVAYGQIAEADLEIKAFKERVAGQGGAPSMEDRIAVGQLMAKAVGRHAQVCQRRIQESLCEVALESVPLPLKRETELFMNRAFFVEGERQEAFEKKIYELGESFHDAVHFKYAGPLPPYSFTGCEITAATPAMLDEARQVLELGETFTKDQFSDQHRKLSLLWHPDRQPGNPEAVERFKRLSASAELLDRFFAQQGQEFVKNSLPETIFLVAKAVGYKEHLEWV
jgi:hypothetical protein